MTNPRPDFKQKLESFFEGCKRIHAEYHVAENLKHHTAFENDTRWNMTWLKRYVRIEMSDSTSNCVQCFVDIACDVLKPAGWKAPAITKTKRGNIFDEHNGLKYFGPHGVASANNIKQTDTDNAA